MPWITKCQVIYLFMNLHSSTGILVTTPFANQSAALYKATANHQWINSLATSAADPCRRSNASPQHPQTAPAYLLVNGTPHEYARPTSPAKRWARKSDLQRVRKDAFEGPDKTAEAHSEYSIGPNRPHSPRCPRLPRRGLRSVFQRSEDAYRVAHALRENGYGERRWSRRVRTGPHG